MLCTVHLLSETFSPTTPTLAHYYLPSACGLLAMGTVDCFAFGKYQPERVEVVMEVQ